MSKIISITEIVKPRPEYPLGNGTYVGEWGGSIITVKHMGREYELTTDVSVRGFGIKVSVTINGDEMSFVEIKN